MTTAPPLPRMAEATGIHWARNFALSACSFRGMLPILSSFMGAGLKDQRAESRRQALLGCHTRGTGKGQGSEDDTLAFLDVVPERAAPVLALPTLQGDEPWHAPSEPCSLPAPGLCTSCPFRPGCSFSHPC